MGWGRQVMRRALQNLGEWPFFEQRSLTDRYVSNLCGQEADYKIELKCMGIRMVKFPCPDPESAR